MKIAELLFEEPGKVRTRVQDKKPEPKGAPENFDRARAFDGKRGKNRSVLKHMMDQRNEFFDTGDMEFNPPDDEMSLPYNPGFDVLIMSGGEDSEKDLMANRYSGISVHFPWDGGEITAYTSDDRGDKEWGNPKKKAKIIAVAKEAARRYLPSYLEGGIDRMIDMDDDSPEIQAVKQKIEKRGANKAQKRIKIMLGD